jgi:predicted glutamine amidotransferase
MCGLVGIAGKLTVKDEATMKRLFLLDFFRGPDSTGLAAVRGDGNIHVSKLASHPIDLFDSARFKTALSGYNSKIFLGHNRYATKGKVNANNAHPYHYGDIVGAHNGTLSITSWRALEKAVGEDFEVDSQAIIAAIAAIGIAETVPLLQGAWSLTWYDKADNTLNFLRNDERPLWYAYTKDFDRIFWASEWPAIDAATKMSAAPAYELYHDEKMFRFWQTEVDLHYKFDMDAFKDSKLDVKPTVVQRKGKEAPPASSGSYDPFNRGDWNHINPPYVPPKSGGSTSTSGKDSTISPSKSFLPKKDKPIDNVVNLFGTRLNPLAGMISEEKFAELAKYGCSWCQSDVDYHDVGVTIYERDDILLCPECSNHDRQKESADHSRVFAKSMTGLV